MESTHQRMAYPLNGVISVAKKARLVLCRRPTSVSIWRIGKGRSATPEASSDHGFELVSELDLNVATHLVSASLSEDGKWIATSDAIETKLFTFEGTVSLL